MPWEPRGGIYQFRLRGCCDRQTAPDPYSMRQVVSEWSAECFLQPMRRLKSARSLRE